MVQGNTVSALGPYSGLKEVRVSQRPLIRGDSKWKYQQYIWKIQELLITTKDKALYISDFLEID